MPRHESLAAATLAPLLAALLLCACQPPLTAPLVEVKLLERGVRMKPNESSYLPDTRYAARVYYVRYASDIDGAVIAALLFVPEGKAPSEGWPTIIASHPFGGPGADFWSFPFGKGDWRTVRGGLTTEGLAFVRHGFVVLAPWMPGAGASEPFAQYDPLALDRNMLWMSANFRVLKSLSTQPGMSLDLTRTMLQPNCVSSATAVKLASQWKTMPEASGLKGYLMGLGPASVAYNLAERVPDLGTVTGYDAAASVALMAGPVYTHAVFRQKELGTFFTAEGARFLHEDVMSTPAGMLPRMRAARLEPLAQSDIAQPLLDKVCTQVGKTGACETVSSAELVAWLFSPAMQTMTLAATSGVASVVKDSFYREHFAESDPYFSENISPFEPAIPGFNVLQLRTQVSPYIFARDVAGYERQTMPIVTTLRSWGWTISDYFEAHGGLPQPNDANDYSDGIHGGPGHLWAVGQAAQLLYPNGTPPELK